MHGDGGGRDLRVHLWGGGGLEVKVFFFFCFFFKNDTLFLAHLSRRLSGELIG